jgi:hypothetical protein
MSKLILITAFLFAGVIGTNAQTVIDCPHPDGCVVISRGAAIKNLETDDKAKALEAENIVLKQAAADFRDETRKMQIELAKVTGEKTGAEQMNVRLTAIVDILLKHVKPKKIGIINF